MFYISGKTFNYKDRLKALGCRWEPGMKCWTTGNPATAEQARGFLGIVVTGTPESTKSAEDLRIEFPSRGRTYVDQEYGVYRYSTYKRSSVLAGQQCREFLGSYLTLELAQAAHPAALPTEGCGYREPFLNHLPGEDDPDPQEMALMLGEDPEGNWHGRNY